MNDTLKKAKGKLKEVAGEVTGDEVLRAKGRIAQKAVDAKDSVGHVVNNTKQKIARKANEAMDKMEKSDQKE